MKYIDLFAGIGGFRYGLEGVNALELGGRGQEKDKLEATVTNIISKPNKRQPAFSCVYSNEWDKYASQIYKKHYGEIDTTDITKVNAKSVPDHDLLTAGFPCQAFSIAGKRRGFEDTRGTLFFDIARILSEKRPRLVLLENVKGLLSHDKGKTFQTILGVLADLGYRVEWQVLNSKHFGVPQNRERVFIVGHLGGFGGRKVFPIRGTDEKDTLSLSTNKIQNRNKKRTNYVAYENTTKRMDSLEQSENWKNYVRNSRIRRLTPTECERLQGFPDGWTEGLSDTQRYKCLGNAVTTNVVQEIANRL
jgi:DNA (cytosine-5)-methyltransferase 1